MLHTIFLAFFLISVTFQQVDAQVPQANILHLEKVFLQNPSNYDGYENLYFLLGTRYEALTADQRKEIRNILDKSTFSKIRIYPPNEAGDRIVIRGTLTDKGANPVAGARITFFQTDAAGYYAPGDSKTKRMSESDARLYGVLRTDSQGHYEIASVRPASYPIKYEGRFIPQHIHFNVSAHGFPELKLQVAFDDDPAMKDLHWREWAKDLEFPVVKLAPANGMKTGICNITLGNK